MKVLIIIPAYNEADNIVNVVENLKNNYLKYDVFFHIGWKIHEKRRSAYQIFWHSASMNHFQDREGTSKLSTHQSQVHRSDRKIVWPSFQ